MNVTVDYLPKRNYCRFFIDDMTIFDNLREAFSVKNEAKKFVKGTNRRFIPDRIYFITPTGQCHFGLAPLILDWIKKNVNTRTVTYHFTPSYTSKFDVKPWDIVRDDLNLKLRDYQKEAVSRALAQRFGTLVMGTGAGKTLTISSIIHNLFSMSQVKRVMILVPDNGLVVQFHHDLVEDYGLKQKVCLFYDKFNTIDEDAEIIIANRPLFLARWAANEKFFREKIDCLIVDEAHSIKKDNKVSKCIEKMVTKYRYGFTGTLAENEEDKMRNLGLLGHIIYEKTSKELRDEGFLTDVTVQCLNLNYTKNVCKGLDYQAEKEWLGICKERNEFLTKLLFTLRKNSLVMVNYLNHGFTLEEYLKKWNESMPQEKKKQIYFIRGEVDTDTREEVKKLMEKENDVICIAITKIFSTGINIKNLHNIVLAAGGKSSVTVVQSIGRGLRLHPDKKELNIWDVIDTNYKYSMKHAEARQKIYEKEKIATKVRNINL